MDRDGRQRRRNRTNDHFVGENVGTRVARIGRVHDRVRRRVVRAEFAMDGSLYAEGEESNREKCTPSAVSWSIGRLLTSDGVGQTILVPLHVLLGDALRQVNDHGLIRGRADVRIL